MANSSTTPELQPETRLVVEFDEYGEYVVGYEVADGELAKLSNETQLDPAKRSGVEMKLVGIIPYEVGLTVDANGVLMRCFHTRGCRWICR